MVNSKNQPTDPEQGEFSSALMELGVFLREARRQGQAAMPTVRQRVNQFKRDYPLPAEEPDLREWAIWATDRSWVVFYTDEAVALPGKYWVEFMTHDELYGQGEQDNKSADLGINPVRQKVGNVLEAKDVQLTTLPPYPIRRVIDANGTTFLADSERDLQAALDEASYPVNVLIQVQHRDPNGSDAECVTVSSERIGARGVLVKPSYPVRRVIDAKGTKFIADSDLDRCYAVAGIGNRNRGRAR
jgi:hypothetical protein